MRFLRFLIASVLASTLASPTLAGGYALITVRNGESLGEIAGRYRVDVDAVRHANDMGSSNLIRPGDVLRVPFGEAMGGIVEAAPDPPPGFRRHVLSSGEHLSAVVARYGITMAALVGANPDLSSLDRLPTGVELLIPPSEGLVVTLYDPSELAALLAHHGADAATVARANGIRSPFDLRAGMLLFLPGIEPSSSLERLARVREEENRYVWPVHGRLTSYFGRRNLGMGTSNFHRGIDVAAPTGTPIIAARAGTVTFAGWSTRGYGYLVRVRHAGGAESWYAHASRILVSVGQSVQQGERIALIGSTGLSTGPHLHFELHVGGTAIDPLAELR
ncbi:MAG: M23 family metallopeptidase [Trueperaceae bacterium]|nr:M23 family metallopeptidase [Trueperaceae bacterium]